METNSKRPDWDRIVHLFKLGIVASLMLWQPDGSASEALSHFRGFL
ncbi:MAG: hypothetical protein K5868_06900 [Lachnospiraceae bacterium]|nr:hypothetical protein [Lachnospiraceae bacterium]